MAVRTLTLDGKMISASDDQTLLQAAREAGVEIPTLCHLEGVTDVGACRMCLVEVSGWSRPAPACVTKVAEGMEVSTQTERLKDYRRQIVELLFAERNHICAVCVANGHCELQDMAVAVGMDHVRFDYQNPACDVDISHERYGLDHNRCILCTRCLRACDEVEGAHTWDLAGRGTNTRVVTDLHQPWGDSATCTSCGKCVEACPTGALFPQRSPLASLENRNPSMVSFLVNAREKKQWNV